MRILKAMDFDFSGCPHALARRLLGAEMTRFFDDVAIKVRIVEVEVYGGAEDKAAHSNRGYPTPSTASMFKQAGTAYIYRIYGMYDCLNVVAQKQEGYASAILIRACEPVDGVVRMAINRGMEVDELRKKAGKKKLLGGPGRLAQALKLDRSLDGRLFGKDWLLIEEPEELEEREVVATERIGLNPETCGPATHYQWRYLLSDSEFLSR